MPGSNKHIMDVSTPSGTEPTTRAYPAASLQEDQRLERLEDLNGGLMDGHLPISKGHSHSTISAAASTASGASHSRFRV